MTQYSLANKFTKRLRWNLNSPLVAQQFMRMGSERTPVGRMKVNSTHTKLLFSSLPFTPNSEHSFTHLSTVSFHMPKPWQLFSNNIKVKTPRTLESTYIYTFLYPTATSHIYITIVIFLIFVSMSLLITDRLYSHNNFHYRMQHLRIWYPKFRTHLAI